MRGRSAAFDDAVTNGGLVVSRLEIVDPQTNNVLNNDDAPLLALADGSATIDVTASVRRAFTATLVDETGFWVPTGITDALSVVSGNYIRLWTGFRYDDGEEELLPLGHFVIGQPNVDDGPDGLLITLAGQDFTGRIRENRWTKPYVVPKDQPVVAAAQAIISNRLPGVQFRGLGPASVSYLTPYLTYDENTDPWDAVMQLLSGAGLEAFFDADGFCVIQAIPDPTVGDPVWSYTEGSTSNMARLKGASSRDDVYNGVVAIGESTYGISPARAEVWDDDPASPTYAGTEASPGKFGRKVKTLPPNPAILFNAQASSVGAAELRRSRRLSFAYDVDLVAHPAQEGGDIVSLTRSRLRIVDAPHVLERFEVPLSGRNLGSAKLRRRL